MKTRNKILTALATIAALTSGIAIAQQHDEHRDNGPMQEAAIAACATQTEGALVNLEHPIWGQVNAVCAKSPRDGKLVAMAPKVVEHMKQSQAACVGKTEGAKVTMTSMRDATQKIDAVCQKRGDVLSAHPARDGKGGKGGKDDKKQNKM